MNRSLKTCFGLSIFFIILLGTAVSEGDKIKSKNGESNKEQIAKNLMNQSYRIFPWINRKYFMEILTPNPGIDPDIFKNNFDPNTDYELRIIEPGTKKEIIDNETPFWDSLKNQLTQCPDESGFQLRSNKQQGIKMNDLFCFPFPGFTQEGKRTQENPIIIVRSIENSNKFYIARTDEKFTMKVIKPYPDIDTKIVKNNYDPNINYTLRIIDPYTGKERTGKKGPYFGFPYNKIQPEGKRYGIPIAYPVKQLPVAISE